MAHGSINLRREFRMISTGARRKSVCRRARLLSATLGLAALAVALRPLPAFAGITLAIAPTYCTPGTGPGTGQPCNETLQTGTPNVPVSLFIRNQSTPLDSTVPITLTNIRNTPACDTSMDSATGDCPVGSQEPNVFSLANSTGT